MKIIIKSKRFTLRPFRKGDEKSLAKNLNNKKITDWLSRVPYPYNLEHAKSWIRENVKELRKRKPKMLNFVIDIDNEVAGSISLSGIIEGYKAEMGYWLTERYWGKGFMTEALDIVTKLGFRKFKLKRIYAQVYAGNFASMKVLEKGGYKIEGILKKDIKKDNRIIDNHVYAKLK
jgi:ribosomal-protein-alanine N-acetyltransferase